MKKLFLTLWLLPCALLAAEDIDGVIKKAVDGLSSRILYPIEVSVGDINLAGTESPSAFSRYLGNRIMAHAPNNLMFRVVPLSRSIDRVNPGGPEKGVITGVFLREGAIVRVTLRLVTEPGGVVLNTSDFKVPAAELERLDIALLPENTTLEAIKKREEILNPPAPAVRAFTLRAWPDSDTRTYLDGDELKISIVADEDCFFKVYHIDLNGDMQLIYPTGKSADNRLAAFVTRTIPEPGAVTYVLQAPFGQDTIKVVAARRQFENLAAEFNTVWKADGETVRRAESYRGLAIRYAPDSPAVETVTVNFNFTVLPAR